MTEVAVIGGGAAGMFAAIHAAQLGASVTIYEAAAEPLAKVRIAGGGRCNITNYCFEPPVFAQRYPRGTRELRAAFGHFQARDLMAWFESRGVALHHEEDGRVFPQTNDSDTIASALLTAADQAGVTLRRKAAVRSIQFRDGQFILRCNDQECTATRVLLATGGSRSAMELAGNLGHRIETPVPALFTLRCHDPLIKDLAGVATEVQVSVCAQNQTSQHQASGPLLITHWGLSGPAILKASSWAARDLAASKWLGTVRVNWCPALPEHALREELRNRRSNDARQQLSTHPSQGLPRRLWERIITRAGLSGTWAQCANSDLEQLLQCLQRCDLAISGKGPFTEEFVVCGGIVRKEIDWRRMESRIQPGLHFAGEVIDQDGLTGGFNLQAAWTTGWLAGRAMAQ